MPWQFVVTDLSGNVHGELTKASERKVSLPHMRTPSASCRIPLNHPLADTLSNSDCLLKAYRTDAVTATKTLAFHGPVVSTQEVGESGMETIAVTAAGPFWRLTKRLIPASLVKEGAQFGSESALLDYGDIARTILNSVNGVSHTGISTSTTDGAIYTPNTPPNGQGWVGKWYFKNVAEAMAELASGVNTIEFRVRPVEPITTPSWPTIGLFDCAPQSQLGTSRPDAIFEYGTARANVVGYDRTVTRDGILNVAYASVSGWPDSVEKMPDGVTDKYGLVASSDNTSISARGYFEEQVADAGVLDAGLRTAITSYHVAIRKDPRQVITFNPAPNARPAPFIDYEVGDTVRARAVVNGSIRFDGLFRIWGLTFNVDENGNENVELELVTP